MKNIIRKAILLFLLLLTLPRESSAEYRRRKKKTTWVDTYEQAIDCYHKKDYFRANNLFAQVIPLLRGTRKAEELHFYEAYCEFHLQEYLKSYFLFSDFHDTYPYSKYAEEAFFMKARCLGSLSLPVNVDQTITVRAMRAFDHYLNNYPEGIYVSEAETYKKELIDKLAKKELLILKFYFKMKNYESVILLAEVFEKNYRTSDSYVEVIELKQKAWQMLEKHT